MGKILPFKTRKQLETDKAVKVMREWEAHLEWEEANWHHIEERDVLEKDQRISQEEIEWLNEWVKKND